jgi:hypothetical protein
VNIGTGPSFIGRLDVMNYGKENPGYFRLPHHGLTIRLSFKDNNSGFVAFEWIQTVTVTQDKPEKETKVDTHSQIGDHDWPFYLSDKDLQDSFFDPPSGYDDYFIDTPARTDNGFIQSFNAELTLLGVDKNNNLVPLITLTYGFSLTPGSNEVDMTPLAIVSTYPNGYSNLSFFHKFILDRAKPRL